MSEWLTKHPDCSLVVITGFVCQTHDGVYSTLGRNGSDFSATIFGALLNAVKVTIWKDVEGELRVRVINVLYYSALLIVGPFNFQVYTQQIPVWFQMP